ncbi:hypothetical protein Taro_019281 [Colocasia esculenta]|uniref:Uncharacterized protein n=1 Tax=Colocasia esculenta TaxID=4460 RepID=A0A843UT07_COLES|nr:hypothetical protein [Colocasia esculenta]
MRGPGELGREAGPGVRLLALAVRPTDGARAGAGTEDCTGTRRVGVDGLELERDGAEVMELGLEFEVAGIWDRCVGVEGLEQCKGRGLSPGVAGLVLEGVEEREGVGREEAGADGLVLDEEDERLPGVDGLEEEIEAVLVLRMEVLLEEESWLEE